MYVRIGRKLIIQFFSRILGNDGQIIVYFEIILKILVEHLVGINQQHLGVADYLVIVVEDMIKNDFTIILIVVFADDVIFIAEGIGNDVFLEIDSAESQLEDEEQFTCLVAVSAFYFEDGVLAISQMAEHDDDLIENVLPGCAFFREEVLGLSVWQGMADKQMSTAKMPVFLGSYGVYFIDIVNNLILIGYLYFSQLRSRYFRLVNQNFSLILQEFFSQDFLQIIIKLFITSIVVYKEPREGIVPNREEILTKNREAQNELQKLQELFILKLGEEMASELNQKWI